MVPTEAAARVVYLLVTASQRGVHIRRLASEIGYTRSGAYKLLCRIARVVPLWCERGRWKVCRGDEGLLDQGREVTQ